MRKLILVLFVLVRKKQQVQGSKVISWIILNECGVSMNQKQETFYGSLHNNDKINLKANDIRGCIEKYLAYYRNNLILRYFIIQHSVL